MKELHARAQTAVTASADECLQLLRAVEGYPSWYPSGVKAASVLERDAAGVPTKVRATLHVATGPFVKDFNLTLALTEPTPGTIKLARQAHGPGDQERFEVTWKVSASGAGGATVALTFDANLSVPRFLPVNGVADGIAGGFVNAAAGQLGR
jgi:ribosome-associated toxin RatA of RatAB toxin-antitoxin module